MKSTSTTVPFAKLLEQLPATYTVADRELVQRAYAKAEEAHRGQKRISGEPYINHCLAVAHILAELRVPPEVLAAGLLHDTVEDTAVTLVDIQREFGDAVASLVDGVTKLTNLPASLAMISTRMPVPRTTAGPKARTGAGQGRRADMASETLRKTFLAMGDDVRVVLIKLADRLHNMRTLGHVDEVKAKANRPTNARYFRAPCQPAGHLADQMGARRPGLSIRQC